MWNDNSNYMTIPPPSSSSHNNVLVTGASGFVGKKMIDRLRRDLCNIRVLTRYPKRLPPEWSHVVEAWEGDVTNPASLQGVADGIDIIYHLAGEVYNPEQFDAVNRKGTENLLKEAVASRVRSFLYLSSVGVWDLIGAPNYSKQNPIREDLEPHPEDLYEVSKLAGERAVLGAQGMSGMQVAVVRPSVVYGEDRNPEKDRFLSWMKLIRSGRYLHISDKAVSAYVYVGDVIEACHFIANHPEAGGEIYTIADSIYMKEFVQEAVAHFNADEPHSLPTVLSSPLVLLLRKIGRLRPLHNTTWFDTTKIERLGFQRPYGYSKGIARTLAAYREAGLLP